LQTFVARDSSLFLATFKKIKNENRALTKILNEINDKFNNIKQIFRDLNEQETIIMQERDEILQERNQILKERDMLKKKLKKAKIVNEYLIAPQNISAFEIASELAFEPNSRQFSIESQESIYLMTLSAVIKSAKISNSLVFKNNKNNDFNVSLSFMRNKLEVNSD
jgi:GTP-sensing pleiotropic transcriptional regulator CodY